MNRRTKFNHQALRKIPWTEKREREMKALKKANLELSDGTVKIMTANAGLLMELKKIKSSWYYRLVMWIKKVWKRQI